jgi:ribosomal protein S18 acetylase RimI-like enzyme
MFETEIRLATIEDLGAVKQLADANRKWLGFVNRTGLAEAQAKGWLYVAIGKRTGKVLGFANVWRRKDGWATVMEICIDADYRGQGLGAKLLHALPKPFRLKCTVDNPANEFYKRVGCKLEGQDEGKKRALNIWILI